MYNLCCQACVIWSEWFSTVSFSRKADDVLHVQQIYIDKSTCRAIKLFGFWKINVGPKYFGVMIFSKMKKGVNACELYITFFNQNWKSRPRSWLVRLLH